MSTAPANIFGVDASVAGWVTVEEDELQRKLGAAAWHVWQVLCKRRNRKGETHVSMRGIASAKEFVAIGAWAVKRALRKLEQAGLVERGRWVEKNVPIPGGRTVQREAFERVVRGARQTGPTNGTWFVNVPDETKAWLASAPTRGGKRKGAGMKKGKRNAGQFAGKAKGGTPLRNQSAPTPGAELPAASVQKDDTGEQASVGIKAPHRRNQSAPTSNQSAPTPPPFSESKCPSLRNQTAPLIKNIRESYTHGECGLDRFFESKAPAALSSSVSLEAEVGTVFGDLTRKPRGWVPLPATPIQGLPPYPGVSVVGCATVPPPLKLAEEHSEDFQVRHLAQCFRGAIEAQYGVKSFLLANVSSKSKSYVALAKAAALLRQYDIAPAAWCIFAVRRWYNARRHTNGWKEGDPIPLPPVGVVFSLSQIEQRLGEDGNRSVVATCAEGGRVIIGEKHKALMARYEALRTAVFRDRVPVEDALGKLFPGSAFDEMVDAARFEYAEIRFRLEDEIKRGRFPW